MTMNDEHAVDGVLVISGLGGWVDGTIRDEKFHAHVAPMRPAADCVTVLSIGAVPPGIDGLDARPIPPSGHRLIDFARLAVVAIRLARSGRYDVIASFSLIPYGMIALLAGWLADRPAHLGIIGMDLDVHATGPFGPVVRWLFRRFAAISVAGSAYRERLDRMGVPASRVHTVLHPVPLQFAESSRATSVYDLVWVGRVSEEKGPHRFLDVVARLRDEGEPVRAAMVGDGPAMDDIEERVEREELADLVDVIGWCDEPIEYYRRSRLYVLTSEREMLPLTLVEAMLAGTPPVTPPLGAVPDLVEDGRTGYVIADRAPATFAATIREALADDPERQRIGERARGVRRKVHPDTVAASWRALFRAMCRNGDSPKLHRVRPRPDHPPE